MNEKKNYKKKIAPFDDHKRDFKLDHKLDFKKSTILWSRTWSPSLRANNNHLLQQKKHITNSS
jgi:hypothetical protein